MEDYKIKYLISALILIHLFTGCTPEYAKLNKSGYKKIEAKDYDGAFKDFDLAISKNDSYWLSYNNRGASYMQQGNYQKALEDFNKSINLTSQNPMALDNRGMCKKLLCDSVGALHDFRAAYSCNKYEIKTQAHLGKLLAEMDSCKEAVSYLDNVIKKRAFDDCNSELELRQLKDKCELKKE